MPIDPSTILAGVQIVRVVADSLVMYQQGQMTDQELHDAWAKVGVNFNSAVAAWEGSKDASTDPTTG